MEKKKKSYSKKVAEKIRQPSWLVNLLGGLIVAFIGFVCYNIIWPPIQRAYFSHVTLAATIRPNSVLIIDNDFLNLELTAQVTNRTKSHLKIDHFKCYFRQSNLWTFLRLASRNTGEIKVMNYEPGDEMAKGDLPPDAHGTYYVFINLPLRYRIQEIKRQWEASNYQLTYEQLLSKVKLSPMDIALEVSTNPKYSDDTAIHLFNR
ncbi:MAG: hypothetical protein ONB16_07080 [candidate division KSB1 bacterium]|nr:hypothetical protein [candidate division KSB1 bacterium]MDZ7341551.1 hypothetical protein [candidate division KSB1 bacterium]